MEPPTWTVLVRSVRTTAAVATRPPSPEDEAVSATPRPAVTATPPATTPPTTAPVTAATATTCLAENSAIGTRPGAPVLGVGTGRLRERVMHSGRADLDVSRRFRAVDPPGRRAYLLAAQVVDSHDGRAVGVYAGSVEIGLVPVGIGEVRDPVGPHAGDVLQVLGLIRRRRDRVGGAQLIRGLGHVLAAGAGALVQIPGRLCPLRDVDVDDPRRADGRVGLLGITVAALAGRPLVQQRRHVARDPGRGPPAGRWTGARPRVSTGASPRQRTGPQAGDLRSAGPAAAATGHCQGGQRERRRHRDDPQCARSPLGAAIGIAFHLPCLPLMRCWGTGVLNRRS